MLDLNLLRVLAAVVEQRTVTAAAERLGLTQPAITHSLNRLRKATGDELFVKDGRGVAPTRAALQLYRDTIDFVHQAEAAVNRVAHFEPSTTTATFRIALTDVGQLVYLPALMQALRDQAPHAQLEVATLDTTMVGSQLQDGDIDAAILSTTLNDRVRSELLRLDHYVCLARQDRFPQPGPPLSHLAPLPRVAMTGSTGHTLVEQRLGEPPAGSVTLNGFSSVPALVSRTDLIAFVPEVLVGTWKRDWPVDSWYPAELAVEVEVRAYFPLFPASPAASWFGALVVDRLRGYPRETYESL